MTEKRLFAIVLAAGRASRYGDTKLLASWRGQPLVRHAVCAAEDACGRRTVLVTGHARRQVHAACAPLAGFLVHNDDYASGIGVSIACAVAAVAGAADGVLLMLGDQPLVDGQHLRRLSKCWRRSPGQPAATRYAGIDGVPAIFPRALFPPLRALRGDRGARRVLQHCRAPLVHVDFEDAAVDIDRPADLAALERDYP